MTIDTRPTALYRTAGERAVRAPSPAHAAWALANRMARRAYGKRGGADVHRLGLSGDEVLFEAQIGHQGMRDFWHETIYFRVRKDA